MSEQRLSLLNDLADAAHKGDFDVWDFVEQKRAEIRVEAPAPSQPTDVKCPRCGTECGTYTTEGVSRGKKITEVRCLQCQSIRRVGQAAQPVASPRDMHKTVPVQVWADIDERIEGFVRYLNTIEGVRTDASCQGTIGEGGPSPYRAYVMANWTPEALEQLKKEFDVKPEGNGAWGYIYPPETPITPRSMSQYRRMKAQGAPVASPTPEEIAEIVVSACVLAKGDFEEYAAPNYLQEVKRQFAKAIREALAAQSSVMTSESNQYWSAKFKCCNKHVATLGARLAAQKNIIATLGEGKAAAEQRAEKAEARVRELEAAKEKYSWWVEHGQDAALERASTLAASLRDVQETLNEFMRMWCWESVDASLARIRALRARLEER